MVAVLITAAACNAPTVAPTTPPDAELVAVGRSICPLMWRWQLAVGDAMNQMSFLAFREPDPLRRQALYVDAFDAIRVLNADLRESVSLLEEGPYSDLLTEEILNGLAHADSILRELSDSINLIHSASTMTPPTYHEIVPRVFLNVEKVIDVPKPELAGYHDPELIRAFMTVPQCQHGVKDADDGIPRYIPPF